MTATRPPLRRISPMSLRTLRTFFLATFVLSWSVGVLLSVFPAQAAGVFGPMGNTWRSPSLVITSCALVLVLAIAGIAVT